MGHALSSPAVWDPYVLEGRRHLAENLITTRFMQKIVEFTLNFLHANYEEGAVIFDKPLTWHTQIPVDETSTQVALGNGFRFA